jgi:hypothetical protein
MNYLFGLSEFSAVVPASVVLGSFIVKKIFKTSFAAALAGIGAPLILPLRELPVLENFPDLPHGYLVGGAWVSILCAGIGWVCVRPLVSAAVSSLGLLRLGYLASLGAALIVAALLIINPQPLASNFPGWKGPAGMILLAASCVSVSRAVWRMLRVTALVALWGVVSLVLASSIFLDKLPHHVSRGDLNKIQGVISAEVVDKALTQLHTLSTRGIGALGLLRIVEHDVATTKDADVAEPVDV